jgi:tetratricopeptide (TPR) repeat protein
MLLLLAGQQAWAQGAGASKYKEAEAARKAKNMKEAIDLYDQAIKLEPINAKYWFRKGQTHLAMKDDANVDQAIKAFEKAVEYNPGLTSGYVMLYKIYANRKDANNAIRYLKLAYEKETDQSKKVKYKVLTAKYYLQQDKPNDALRELQDAKALSPNDLQVLLTEGDVQGALGNWTQALDSYNKAYSIAVAGKLTGMQLAKYQIGVGLANYKLGKTAEYEKIYNELNSSPVTRKAAQRLARLAKGNQSSLPLRLATAYMSISEFDEAKKYANQAIQQGNNLAMGYQVLGYIHARAGENSLAISAFGKAAAEEKDPAKLNKIHSTMVMLQFKNGDYQPALTTANKILEKSPDNVKVLFTKALSEYKLGRFNDCIASIDKVLANPTVAKSGDVAKAKYYFLAGVAAKKANKLDKAKDSFTKAQFGSFKAAAKSELQALGAK